MTIPEYNQAIANGQIRPMIQIADNHGILEELNNVNTLITSITKKHGITKGVSISKSWNGDFMQLTVDVSTIKDELERHSKNQLA